MPDPVKHLFLRIPKDRKGIDDFRAAHDEVSNARGAVWVGITGSTLSAARQRELADQILHDMKTYVYVAQMVEPGGIFRTYRSAISAITSSYLSIETELLPAYYSQERIVDRARFWIKVTCFENVGSTLFQSLRVAGSGKPAADVLMRSMLSKMFVCEANQIKN